MAEIEFGRNPDTEKLKITCAGKVINKDIRLDASVSKRHCLLTVSNNGEMILRNLNPDNVTFLNGVSINSKKFELTDSTKITMGARGCVLPLQEVLKELGFKQTYSIGHLKGIIAGHKEKKIQMQIALGRQNAMRGLMPAFMALAAVLGFTDIMPDNAKIIPSVFSLVFACYFGYKGFVGASNNPKKQMELDEKFHKECVCPNPDCHHFLPGEYEDILRAGACPWCRSKFKE